MESIAGTSSSARPGPAGTARNFYASAEFLGAVGAVYFPTRECRVEDFELEGQVFRLLTVDGRAVVKPLRFLDLHEPLAVAPGPAHHRKIRRLSGVSRGMVSVEEFKSNPIWNDPGGAPTVRWDGFASWDEYLDLLRSRRVLADDQRRLRRLVEALGPAEFTVDDLREDVLPTCFSWKSARDRKMERSDSFLPEENRAFFRELRARSLLRASTLRAGGKLLAIWLGAVYRERWTGWVFAFNPEPSWNKYSLGRQLLYPMLEESYRAGHQEFDFSIGMEPYKLFFATHVRIIASLGAPRARDLARAVAKGLLRNRPGLYLRAKALGSRI
jgi:hypothetical protein